ncbi:MAG: hypothetical protein R3F43_18115 [bacterium]
MTTNRPLEIRFWAATDTGRTRDHNEDNFLVDKKLNLFVVADGMGGHAAGEVASSRGRPRGGRRVVAENRERGRGLHQRGRPPAARTCWICWTRRSRRPARACARCRASPPTGTGWAPRSA